MSDSILRGSTFPAKLNPRLTQHSVEYPHDRGKVKYSDVVKAQFEEMQRRTLGVGRISVKARLIKPELAIQTREWRPANLAESIAIINHGVTTPDLLFKSKVALRPLPDSSALDSGPLLIPEAAIPRGKRSRSNLSTIMLVDVNDLSNRSSYASETQVVKLKWLTPMIKETP